MQTITTYNGISNNNIINNKLLAVLFITYIPNTLNAGKIIGKINNDLSNEFRLNFGRAGIGLLFTLYSRIANTNNDILTKNKSGILANGVLYPKKRRELFINNPTNITNDTLRPTDSTNFSVNSNSSNFRILRIKNPGKIVRTRNPIISLK